MHHCEGDSADARAVCRRRAEQFDRDADGHERVVRLCARLRLVVFIAAVVGMWALFAADRDGAAWGAGGAMAVVFALLAVRQRAARLHRTRFRLMADFNREGIARVERRWDDLPLPPDLLRARPDRADDNAGLPDRDAHDCSADLDLGGPASLLHLIGVCGTRPGWRTLQRWLLAPAPPAEVRRRQEAVREMASAFDFRDRLAAEARLVGAGAEVRRDFAQPPATPLVGPWQRAAAWILPPVNLTAIGLNAAGAAPVALVAWTLLASTLALLPRWKAVHRRFAVLDDGESGLRRYGPVLQHLHRAPLRSPMATSIRQRLGAPSDPGAVSAHNPALAGDGHAQAASPPATRTPPPRPRPAHQEIAALRRLLDMADVRRSPLFHLPLAVVLHWDVHVLVRLERWTERCGPGVPGWLDAVGEAEALAALSALAADHPDWTMPALRTASHPGADPASPTPPAREPPTAGSLGTSAPWTVTADPPSDIQPDQPAQPDHPPTPRTFRARALGHPLLPPADCMRNDVDIGPPGSFLLVTGSNMSGKSTLLRAVGLNAVLAQAGGPVCASELHMPPMRVVTSMRIEDSLAGGVSHFMAELLRLRRVVDVARTSSRARSPAADRSSARDRSSSGSGASSPARTSSTKPTAPTALYLLDEILQGTNSAERRIAARTVLRHLLDTDAIGAVTTHDLSLADADDLIARACAVHFAETVADGLTFDYRLRQGLATSTNALKLLEMAGLGRD